MPYIFNVFSGKLDYYTSTPNVLIFKGAIATSSDFPTNATVQTGWLYVITADVTDNNPAKTNTGQSFLSGDEIVWNGINWTNIGGVLTGFVKLDQTIPQTIINGKPIFNLGLTSNSDLLVTGNSTIRTNTTDGTDTEVLMLAGGGAVGTNRGGSIILYGNEVPLVGLGHVLLAPGTGASCILQGNIQFSSKTTNGFVKTSGGDGTISIDTNTYLTSSTGLLLDQTTPQTVANGYPVFSTGLSATGVRTNSIKSKSGGYDFLTFTEGVDNSWYIDTPSSTLYISTAPEFTNVIASQPFYVTSTNKITNLNADLLDGHHSTDFLTSVTAHNILSATHGDTLADTVVAGDIIIGNATPKWARLAKGTDGKVLTMTAGFPSWETPTSGFTNPMTTLGDIIYEDATPTAARLAGNTTTTKKYLSQTGTGAISAVPSWQQVAYADISGTPSLTGYALLDGSNQPFTGNLNISKTTPTLTLTSTDDSNATVELKRATTNGETTLKAYTGVPAGSPGAVNFGSSTGKYITLPNMAGYVGDNGAATISMWVYQIQDAMTTGNHQYLFNPKGLDWHEYYQHPANNYIYANAGFSFVLGTGAWHHIVIAQNGTNTKIWKNNISYSQAATTTYSWTSPYIGSPTPANFYGYIDEVNIWNRVLTDAEIGDLYNSGNGRYVTSSGTFPSTSTPMSTNLVAIYHMDEGSGTTINDTSGNGLHGTMTGGTWTTGKVTAPASDQQITVLDVYDGVNAGERGIIKIGDQSSGSGSRVTVEGLTTRFNILGSEKGQLSSTGMAWALPNTITGSSDAIQLKVIANGTQTNPLFQLLASDGTTNRFKVDKNGYTQIDSVNGNNIYIGSGSVPSNTAALYNVGIGYRALTSLSTNNGGNTAVGYDAGYNITSGSYNSAYGYGSMQAGVGQNGSYNNGFGYFSMRGVTSGSNNNGFGSQAGRLLTTGNYNSYFGDSSGYTNTTGSNNLFLGYHAGYYQATPSNIFLVDNQDRTNAANELTNSLMYGVFNATPSSQTLRFNANVGIGIAPTSYLTIKAGTATANTAPIKLTSGTPLTLSEAGAIEFYNDDYYATITTGAGGGVYTSQYPPSHDNTYVKATSYYDAAHYPWLGTDPSKSLIGSGDNNSFATGAGQTQTRFHIDLNSAIAITRIYYENFHNSGANTNFGVKTFTFWGSNNASAFADLTYGSDTNWTQITGLSQGTFDQHTGSNQADPKYITTGNTTAYRYYAVKISDSWGGSNMGFRRLTLQSDNISAQKKVLLANIPLTSGRVPYTTTNGRLTDSANLTYDGTTLTLGDANNIAVNTTTGTKIGTATSQKLGFFNATPVVQPIATTDLGTVLSDLGLRASGTAYPITTSGAINFSGGLTVATTGLTITDVDIALGTTTGTKIGTATSQKLGFYNATPIIQPTALTAGLTTITYSEPGTPDYAIQDLTQSSPYGFVTADEAQTLLKVVANLQTKVAELESKLEALGLIASN